MQAWQSVGQYSGALWSPCPSECLCCVRPQSWVYIPLPCLATEGRLLGEWCDPGDMALGSWLWSPRGWKPSIDLLPCSWAEVSLWRGPWVVWLSDDHRNCYRLTDLTNISQMWRIPDSSKQPQQDTFETTGTGIVVLENVLICCW